MGLGIPDLGAVIKATEQMPEQFDALVVRLDSVVDLLTEQNDLLRTIVNRDI